MYKIYEMKSGFGMKLIDLFVFNQHGTVIIPVFPHHLTPLSFHNHPHPFPSLYFIINNQKKNEQKNCILIMIIVFA